MPKKRTRGTKAALHPRPATAPPRAPPPPPPPPDTSRHHKASAKRRRKAEGSPASSTSRIRDRIIELRPHPQNWRQHPEAQREALRGVLAEIGYADALLARELEDGSLELIDGHLRADLTPDQEVPVLVVDLDREEARKLLAVHDPLVAMAEADDQVLADLLAGVPAEDADFRHLLDSLASAESAGRPGGEGRPGEAGPQEMKLRPHEHYDYLIVLARNTHEWNRLCELLRLELVRPRHGRIGFARGIPATQLIEIIEHGNLSDRDPQ